MDVAAGRPQDRQPGDGTLPSSGTSVDSGRARYLAFAFTAADLLVEASPDGIVGFAAGAFAAHLRRDAVWFIGRPVAELVCPADIGLLHMVIANAMTRGRTAPVIIHLANPERIAVSLAALRLPTVPPRLCLTFAGLPATLDASPASALARGASALVQAALPGLEATLPSGSVGLVEIQGWAELSGNLPPAEREALERRVGACLATSGGQAVASAMGGGRFGVLACGELDMPGLLGGLRQSLRQGSRSEPAIAGIEVALVGAGVPPGQAARALRYVLACFSDGGLQGADQIAAGQGLAAVINMAEARAERLRLAIVERRFRLRFQPVVDLATRDVHHFEALLRPVLGPASLVRSTQEFVCLAEAVGLAAELDTAVLSEAIVALTASPRARVAVNVSGLSLEDASFRSMALQRASEAGLAGRLMFELTETSEIKDFAGTALGIRELRAADIPMCLDDFGAGAAAFRYLREFPVDFVKIDGSYVWRACESPRERGIAASMVELARSVGARTVAEMIETDEQAKLMRQLGVDFGQGWLLGRPGALPSTI